MTLTARASTLMRLLTCHVTAVTISIYTSQKDAYSTYSGPCSKAVYNELHYEPKNDIIVPNSAGGSEIHPK
jgi:hypothetical protein